MKEENIINEKSFAFAIRIVKLYKYLTKEKKRVRHIKANFEIRDEHRSKYKRSCCRANKTHVCCKTQHCTV